MFRIRIIFDNIFNFKIYAMYAYSENTIFILTLFYLVVGFKRNENIYIHGWLIIPIRSVTI